MICDIGFSICIYDMLYRILYILYDMLYYIFYMLYAMLAAWKTAIKHRSITKRKEVFYEWMNNIFPMPLSVNYLEFNLQSFLHKNNSGSFSMLSDPIEEKQHIQQLEKYLKKKFPKETDTYHDLISNLTKKSELTDYAKIALQNTLSKKD